MGIAGKDGGTSNEEEDFNRVYCEILPSVQQSQRELGLDGRWEQTAGRKVGAKLSGFLLMSMCTVLCKVLLR